MITICMIVSGGMQLDFSTIAGPYHYTDLVFRKYGDSPHNYLNKPQHYSDFNFLQSTVYAVFGKIKKFLWISLFVNFISKFFF